MSIARVMSSIKLFPMMKVLHFYTSTSRRTCAAPNMAAFCSLLMLCFPGILIGYFLNDQARSSGIFEWPPVIIIITCYIPYPCNLTQRCTEIASALFRLLLASSRFCLEPLLTSQRTCVCQFMALCYFRLK